METRTSPRYYFEAAPLAPIVLSGRRLALFLDFDGTLAPIRKDHEEPRLPPATKGLLESLAGSGRAAVTIISGRSLSDLRKRAFVRGAGYAGSHGLEISGPGIDFVHKGAEAARPAVEAIYHALPKEINGRQGVRIERKPFSFAIHYRAAPAGTASLLRRWLEEEVTARPDYGDVLMVVQGKKVFEVTPRVSWNKGAAALHMMAEAGGGHVPICIGDDATDETLFEAFAEKGVTVRVGFSGTTAARYYLRGCREVRLLLKWIDEVLG